MESLPRMSSTGPLPIQCRHGTGVAAVVCTHLLRTVPPAVGFVENSSDPNDLQAWCDACEALFVAESEMSPEFLRFNGMSVVCTTCYAEMRARHGGAPSAA